MCVRVGSAVLTEGDVVTIGNVDLVFTHGTLVRRTEAATGFSPGVVRLWFPRLFDGFEETKKGCAK